MLKRSLYLSVSLMFGAGLCANAQAELKINPYPQGVSAVKSDMSKAEPIDLIQEPSAPEVVSAPLQPLDYAPPPPPIQEEFPVDMSEAGVGTSGMYRSKEDFLLRNGYKIPAMPVAEAVDVQEPPQDELADHAPAYASTKAWARPDFTAPRVYTNPPVAAAEEQQIFDELDALSPVASDPDVALAPLGHTDSAPSVAYEAPAPVAAASPVAPVALPGPRLAQTQPVMQQHAMATPKWHSFAGANVRETLDVWSQEAGVELIWSHRDSAFDVRNTMNVEGTYEEAVQALLEQYDNARMRPVGSLHVDSQTGKRTLVIEVMQDG